MVTNCIDLLALPFIIFFTSDFKSDTRSVAWIGLFLHQCVLVASVLAAKSWYFTPRKRIGSEGSKHHNMSCAVVVVECIIFLILEGIFRNGCRWW